MLLEQFFYSVCWVSCVSVIWFLTDFVLYYGQLFGIGKKTLKEYTEFIKTRSDGYFPDFLIEKSIRAESKLAKFVLKLVGCPFCLIFWLSCIPCFLSSSFELIAPVYLLSLFMFLQIKRLF